MVNKSLVEEEERCEDGLTHDRKCEEEVFFQTKIPAKLNTFIFEVLKLLFSVGKYI